MIRELIAKTGFLLFPPTCVLCGEPGAPRLDLCAPCRDDLPYIHAPCRRCGVPVVSAESGTRLCGRCITAPPRFDALVSPLVYASPADWMIHRLKFNARMSHVRVLSDLLADRVARQGGPLPDALISVPLHVNRWNERGFNQALEIARPVARRFGIPLAADACRRLEDTPHQLSLPAKQRRSNVRKVFALNESVQYRHVAIVDDVVTTASTVNELARLLKGDGVTRVDVWTVARAVSNEVNR